MLKILTCCYAGMLAALVVLANVGWLQPLLAWLHRLPYGDKTCHFLLFGGLSFLLSVTLSAQQPRRRLAIVVSTILALAAITSLEECSQSWLMHRRFDQFDMLCNIAGTFIFGAVTLLLPLPTAREGARATGKC